MTAKRLASGGLIDRTQPLSFKWEDKTLSGYAGDTLASALLANNQKILGRSFKYHRPRGVMSAGVEESGALVTIGEGAYTDVNVRPTTQELYDGLVATGQNAYPNVNFDLGEINNVLGRFLAAGFYYKTFMGLPPFESGSGTKIWMWYERFIRQAAGMGKVSREADPDSYEHQHAFCDVLVVGAGIAGLSAAVKAGEAGAAVWLVEQDFELGGDALAQANWEQRDKLVARAQKAGVRVMNRTTAFGLYDHRCVGLLERVTDHLANPSPALPRQRFWIIRTQQIIVATGAIERLFAFGNNDKPGTMNARTARHYLNRFGVLAGQEVVIATNNDSAYNTAFDLSAAGATVNLLDVRQEISDNFKRQVVQSGVQYHRNTTLAYGAGWRRIMSAGIAQRHSDAEKWFSYGEELPCDSLLISGGWSPVLHLVSQLGIKPVWNPDNQCFIAPTAVPVHLHIAGSAAGIWQTAACEQSGKQAARDALDNLANKSAVYISEHKNQPSPLLGGWENPIEPLHEVKMTNKKSFIDFLHDVTVKDVQLAKQEGFVSVEHLKRYTTLGMANDQGKMGNVVGLSVLANELSQPIDNVGTTTFRPPYTPVAIGALAGRGRDEHFRVLRRTPLHDWNLQQGAVMTMAGLWQRAWYYPSPGESLSDAYRREAATVRQTVGLCDVSSLGKIAIQGADATTLINRVYCNNFDTLAVGKIRYGVMLRDDGIVMDDGTTWRVGENDYLMTTTTAHAAKVMAFLEECAQVRWQELDVHITTVTDAWAAVAVAGPLSRQVVAACLADPHAVDDQNLKPMAFVDTPLKSGVMCRIGRVSFSGERGFEVYIPANNAATEVAGLWQQVQQHDGCLYGLEALGTLRIEKGHVTGAELDGRVSLQDAGLGKMASAKKPFVGGALAQREALQDDNRPRLVGIFPQDKTQQFKSGSILCDANKVEGMGEGWITAVTHSPALGHWIGLGFINGGHTHWQNKTLVAADPVRDSTVAVTVVSPHMYDPKGERMNG